MTRQFFADLARREAEGHPFVIATVVDVGGSTPRAAGARMVIDGSSIDGTVGGGALEQRVIDDARNFSLIRPGQLACHASCGISPCAAEAK